MQDGNWLAGLYDKYSDELREVTRISRGVYDTFLAKGWGATFSDVEAETLYLLVRESKPDTIFEISPDCGYSTHYILQALTRNGKGTLYSFELSKTIRGLPTEEAIRSIQVPTSDLKRLKLIIGDARITVPETALNPDFVFLDSCHDDFFAEWYVKFLLPKCKGFALVHDIMYPGGTPELSTESTYLQYMLLKFQIKAVWIGDIDRVIQDKRKQLGLTNRRAYYSLSAWIPDCSALKSSYKREHEETFLRFIKQAGHTQTIQSQQVSGWKDPGEKVSVAKSPLMLPVDTIVQLAPLTLAEEIRTGHLSEIDGKSLLQKAPDIYARVRLAKALRITAPPATETDVTPGNPIALFYALRTGASGDWIYPFIENICSSDQITTYWKLRIIHAMPTKTDSIDFKEKQLLSLLDEIHHSNIRNKRIFLELFSHSPKLPEMVREISRSLLEDTDRDQLAHRELLTILRRFRKHMDSGLIKRIEDAIPGLVRGRKRASFEAAVEFMLQLKPVRSAKLFNRSRYAKETTSISDNVRLLMHVLRSKLRDRVLGLNGDL